MHFRETKSGITPVTLLRQRDRIGEQEVFLRGAELSTSHRSFGGSICFSTNEERDVDGNLETDTEIIEVGD
ncbi:hypothetical protein O9929_18605 [Vibrio lentus]|nr:hypothetical protein [Vibrio lentus]